MKKIYWTWTTSEDEKVIKALPKDHKLLSLIHRYPWIVKAIDWTKVPSLELKRFTYRDDIYYVAFAPFALIVRDVEGRIYVRWAEELDISDEIMNIIKTEL